ncbi:hypothetical protein SLA2020_046900 [Shorea laevis]
MCCSCKMSFLILTFVALSLLDGRILVARAQPTPINNPPVVSRPPINQPPVLPSPPVVPRPPINQPPAVPNPPVTQPITPIPSTTQTLVTPPPAEYYFTVEDANFTKFCETRTILTINGTYPGPEIRIQRGQTVRVHVLNKGTYGITIHWHGVKQPRNPWSDGPENVTQCPIQSGKSFTYEVVTSDEIGTLWWHAHSDWSRATVHGAFVILPPTDEIQDTPYRFPNHTLVFSTWYNQDLKEISDIIAANGSAIANATGYTLNGLPGDQVICGNVSEQINNMTVKRGETYLLRLVHAAMHEPQYFGITAHNLTVVARDGALVKPFSTEYVLRVNTNDQNTTGFLIYSDPVDSTINSTFPTLPGATDNSTAFNFTAQLRSLYSRTDAEVPRGNVNLTRIILKVQIDRVNCTGSPNCPSGGGKGAASFNRISFAAPTGLDILRAYIGGNTSLYNTSYLLTPDEVLENATYAYQGTNVIELNYGDPVEIVFQAIDFGPAGVDGQPFDFSQIILGYGLCTVILNRMPVGVWLQL